MTREELTDYFAHRLAEARFGPEGQKTYLDSDYRKAQQMVDLAFQSCCNNGCECYRG